MTALAEAVPLLSVDRLSVAFPVNGREALAVNEVSFTVDAGETLCVVGESGSGKSMTALAILRLVPPPGQIVGGAVTLRGRPLLSLSEHEMRAVRGAEIALIFQEPMTALNPVFTIGDQIAETLSVHGLARGRAAWTRAEELLDAVRIPDPARRAREYPHQLSGGLRQRALIAMALACGPALLIADEPTTALDATIQAEILSLLREMKEQLHLSLLLITHDLGVVAETADRVAVMYAGRIVEQGSVRQIFRDPLHPYTQGLLASIPGGTPGARLRAIDGTVPTLDRLPPGCAFAPRCPARFAPCDSAPPASLEVAPGRTVRCYLHDPATRSLGSGLWAPGAVGPEALGKVGQRPPADSQEPQEPRAESREPIRQIRIER